MVKSAKKGRVGGEQYNMNVGDLKCGDLIELFWDINSRKVLSDEFDYDVEQNLFLTDEDDTYYYSFDSISKIWREDAEGNYVLIYNKDYKERIC